MLDTADDRLYYADEPNQEDPERKTGSSFGIIARVLVDSQPRDWSTAP